MQYNFYIQDPYSQNPHYLIEAIIEQLRFSQTLLWKSLFAFATRPGIECLLGDPDVKSFLRRGNTELVIGIDAITDHNALEKLRKMEVEYEKFNVRVFCKQMQGIFHPKIAYFVRDDGKQVMIIGSGNLTSGGLKSNIEAYSVIICEPHEKIDFEDMRRFFEIHSDSLREIDAEILDLARQNRILRRKRKIIEEVEPEEPYEEKEEIEIVPTKENSRILIAEVPRAGTRWHQVHFNLDVNKQFFRVQPNSSERAYLFEKISSTQIGPEEVRPVVFSRSNRNIRIEFASRRHEPYPSKGRPTLIIREVGTRIFHYVLLMPKENGYREMVKFLNTHRSIGKGLRRSMTTYDELMVVWKTCPL